MTPGAVEVNDATIFEARDGTRWFHHARFPDGEWTGWESGEEGVWVRTQDEMERQSPEVVAAWRSTVERG
jgi:hypothetical protein